MTSTDVLAVPHVTAGLALDLLREVVEERPDHVFPGPNLYVGYMGDPLCLIGHVLVRAGVDPAKLRDVNKATVTGLSEMRGYIAGVRIAEDAARILGAAQDVQDERRPWSEALQAAELVAEAEQWASA